MDVEWMDRWMASCIVVGVGGWVGEWVGAYFGIWVDGKTDD